MFQRKNDSSFNPLLLASKAELEEDVCNKKNFDDSGTTECSEWVYDNDEYQITSTVTEVNSDCPTFLN